MKNMTIVLSLQNLTQIFWAIIIVLNLYVLLLLYRMSKLYRAERQIKLLATANLKENIEFMRSRPTKSIATITSSTATTTTRSRFFEQFDETQTPRLRSCLRVRPNFRSYSSTTAAEDDPAPLPQSQPQPQKQQQRQQRRTSQAKDLKVQLQPQKLPQHQHSQQLQQQQQPQQQQRNVMANRQSQHQPHAQETEPCKELEMTSSSSVPGHKRDERRYVPQPDDEHTLYISDSFGRVVHEIPFRERDYVDALYAVIGDRRWKVERSWSDRVGEIQCRESK